MTRTMSINKSTTDLTGKSCGKWSILGRGPNKGKFSGWNCRCECGHEQLIAGHYLRSSKSNQCRHCYLKGRTINLDGQRFGSWTVIESKPRFCLCECDCGNQFDVFKASLLDGVSTQCQTCQGRNLELSGQKFGKWSVLRRGVGNCMWVCQCACGAEAQIKSYELLNDRSHSCKNCASTHYVAGQKINRWTLLEIRHNKNGIYAGWLCKCPCKRTTRTICPGELLRKSGCKHCSRQYVTRSISSRFGKLRYQGYEDRAIKLWDRHFPEITSVDRGPCIKTTNRKFYPDFQITNNDGNRFIVEIKSVWTLYRTPIISSKSYETDSFRYNREKYDLCAKWCDENNCKFVLWCINDRQSFVRGLQEQGLSVDRVNLDTINWNTMEL